MPKVRELSLDDYAEYSGSPENIEVIDCPGARAVTLNHPTDGVFRVYQTDSGSKVILVPVELLDAA